ncbi:helix-turn-helix transcriptional regulator [Streptomyces sp. NPDC097617]|uniref:helix-turn-helix domain-containing protein n=1 Tax=Streptomyces sp. NPDC097617 TaxID=3366091 RepID=UPI0037F63C86
MNRNELDPDAGPSAAFGVRLRRLREEHGWTLPELGERMDYSGSHISGVENATRAATVKFARRADAVFGLADSADSFERESRRIHQGVLLEGFPEYVGYEGRAVEIRLFQIGIVPGLLQTPEYARALATSDIRRGSITPDQAEERVSFLMQRQATLTRDQPPMLLVVMDESCILRPIGGPAIMAAQLEKLAAFAELPNSVLQVAPFAIGERRPFHLPVNLLTLGDRSLVAYAETHAQGHVDRESTAVLPLLAGYHHLQAESLPQAASVAMIHEVRKGTP